MPNGFVVTPDGTRAYAAEDGYIACFALSSVTTDEVITASHLIMMLDNTVLDLATTSCGNVMAVLETTNDGNITTLSAVEYTFEGEVVHHEVLLDRPAKSAPVSIACDQDVLALALHENDGVSVHVFPRDRSGYVLPWTAPIRDLHGLHIQDGLLVMFGISEISLCNIMTGLETTRVPANNVLAGSVFRNAHTVFADATSFVHVVQLQPLPMYLGYVPIPVEVVTATANVHQATQVDVDAIMSVTCSQNHVFVRTLANHVFVYDFIL